MILKHLLNIYFYDQTRWTCHLSTKGNILFLIFACDIETYIEYLYLWSNILTLTLIRYIFLHVTAQVAYVLFLGYFQVSPDYKIWRNVMVSYSGLPTQYYYEKISNEIPCVNSFLIFIITLNFEMQIRNRHCAPSSQQDNIRTFILAWNKKLSILVHL